MFLGSGQKWFCNAQWLLRILLKRVESDHASHNPKNAYQSILRWHDMTSAIEKHYQNCQKQKYTVLLTTNFQAVNDKWKVSCEYLISLQIRISFLNCVT